MKKVLLLGATGATGSLVAKRLLISGLDVVTIVRTKSRLSEEVLNRVEVIEGEVSAFSDDQLRAVLQGCDACISCLGHNLTFKGVFGQPRELVTGIVNQLIRIKNGASEKTFKFVLMSSSGVQNRTIEERPDISQRMVVSMIRKLLPPHRDNELAAEALVNSRKGAMSSIEWVVVRPDTLIDKLDVTPFQTYESPIRNVIFNAGQSSRINVAEFMHQLLIDDALWESWKFKMPVIYDQDALV